MLQGHGGFICRKLQKKSLKNLKNCMRACSINYGQCLYSNSTIVKRLRKMYFIKECEGGNHCRLTFHIKHLTKCGIIFHKQIRECGYFISSIGRIQYRTSRSSYLKWNIYCKWQWIRIGIWKLEALLKDHELCCVLPDSS